MTIKRIVVKEVFDHDHHEGRGSSMTIMSDAANI